MSNILTLKYSSTDSGHNSCVDLKYRYIRNFYICLVDETYCVQISIKLFTVQFENITLEARFLPEICHYFRTIKTEKKVFAKNMNIIN